MDLPADIDKMNKKFRIGDMTWEELFEHLDRLHVEKEKIDAEVALVDSLRKAAAQPGDLNDHLSNLRYQSRAKMSEINNTNAEIQLRPALAFGCICFVLVGCPIGIWFSKSDYLSAFITCFLPIVFLYYPLLLCGSNLAKTGKFPAPVVIWSANAIMAAVAVPLYRKLLKN